MDKRYTCPMDPDVIKDSLGKCPKCGMDLVPLGSSRDDHSDHGGHSSMEQDFKRRFFITLPLTLLAMALSPHIQMWFGFHFDFPAREFVLFLIGSIIFFFGGKPFFKSARAEISAKNPGMMSLVAIAITVGYTFSVAATFLFPRESLYWEIATLITVFLLGHWLEMRAVRGATGALSELSKLIPNEAHLIGKNGNIVDVKTSEIKLGDTVLVKPGEKIPVDGVVISGESSVNESMISGESRSIGKKKNDRVIGGTINNDGALTIKVDKTGEGTVIAQITKLVQDATASKPKVQFLADRAASVLTFVALFAGSAAFVFWFFIDQRGAVFASTLAVSAIVVACPHALGLAIPTVTTITSTLGARAGILIKDMKSLEIARKVDYVVFDKTGTLTEGLFGVVDILLGKNSKISEKELLTLASSIEASSQHSIAEGIVREAKKQKIKIPKVDKFTSFPGKGASGVVNGKKVLVGNKKLLEHKKIVVDADEVKSAATKVYVAVDKNYAGVILLEDIVRSESRDVVNRLHKMGIKTAMLTGDGEEIAVKVGTELGVDTIFSEVLPSQKVDKIKELQKKGAIVAMVGDGVNDAPSLIQSHVGIAIGAGTDVAVESAGIVLMKNDPMDVVRAINLSRQTNSKMVQNLLWAAGYNVFAIPLAAGVLYPSYGILLRPEWSAILMSASSIIVVFNALLLRRAKLD